MTSTTSPRNNATTLRIELAPVLAEIQTDVKTLLVKVATLEERAFSIRQLERDVEQIKGRSSGSQSWLTYLVAIISGVSSGFLSGLYRSK